MAPRVHHVQIRNYKSLADVDVRLEPLTVLVGSNGSGKSNFVDALAFVRECLEGSIELACKSRGGGLVPSGVGLVVILPISVFVLGSCSLTALQRSMRSKSLQSPLSDSGWSKSVVW